jgi:hypothetical protein
MRRFLLSTVVLAVASSASCGPSFKDRRTPSGDFCSDMLVIPAGQTPDREHHRLQPIRSDITAKTEAERLESLRKAACLLGGDAVIEAVNEEVRGDNAQYVTVSSGTAVIWIRHPNGESKPISILTVKKEPAPDPTPEPTADPAPDPAPAPSTAKSAKPGTGKPPKPGTKPAPSSGGSSASAPDGGVKK